jgi:hypothetical protein
MNEHDTTHSTATPVDELWLADWAAEGLAAIERYLAKQAAFAAFLAARSLLDSGHGNGADPV